MLRLTGHDNETDDRLRPIPFPTNRARGRDAHRDDDAGRSNTPGRDVGWMAEKAIEKVQSRLDELDELLDETYIFPSNSGDDDDGPDSAA